MIALLLLAALLPSEQHAIRTVCYQAVLDIASAERSLKNRGIQVAYGASMLVRASKDLSRGCLILYGGNPENEGDKARMEAWDRRERSEQVGGTDGAFWSITGSVDAIRQASTELSRHAATPQAALDRLDEAQTKLLSLNRGLTFKDPCPAVQMPAGCTVFGPHGSWAKTLTTLAAHFNYLYDWAEGNVAWHVKSPGPENSYGSPYDAHTIIKTQSHYALLLISGADGNSDQVCRSLAAFRIWGHEQEELFDVGQKAAEASRAWILAGKWSDSWKQKNWAWPRMLDLFNSARCR